MTDRTVSVVVPPTAPVNPACARRDHAEIVARILAKVTVEWAQHFPDAAMAPRVAAVHYDQRRLSDIARAELETGSTRVAVYIKIHKHHVSTPDRIKQKARREFDTLTNLHASMKSTAGSAVPRPLAFFPEELAVVTEEVKGQNLYRLIKTALRPYSGLAARRTVEAHCEASGRWLRQFQAVTRQDTSRPLREEGLLAELIEDLKFCVSRGLPRAFSVRLVEFCEDWLAQLDGQTGPIVGMHPDYQPDNVVARPDGVSVLDFTSFGYGSPWSDVGRFVATLEFLGKHPLYSRRRIAALRLAFLRGYGVTESDADPVVVYVIRFLTKAARAVATWPAPSLVRRLRERQAMTFLAAWTRRLAGARGTDVLLAE